ncbi:hypothetical protein ANRL2_03151 [Anaerolineae bacterium]|nr:hypothetical protein ANRL2_03151 [Anaerolineae bacterium]
METSISLAISVLSAVITPVVLISATALLTLSTSTRVSRVLERARNASELLEELEKTRQGEAGTEERYSILLIQFKRARRRSELLSRALGAQYASISAFAAASVAIGAASVWTGFPAILVILFGFSGVTLLFYSSVLLIIDSRIGLGALRDEMELMERLARSMKEKKAA